GRRGLGAGGPGPAPRGRHGGRGGRHVSPGGSAGHGGGSGLMPTSAPQSPEQAHRLSAADLRSRFLALIDLLSALRRILETPEGETSATELAEIALSELLTHLGLHACSVFLRRGQELQC